MGLGIARQSRPHIMTAALLLLMPYELIGTLPHEIIGTAMLVLFVIHHILNRRWFGSIFKGKYTPYRIYTNALDILLTKMKGFGDSLTSVELKTYFDIKELPVP